MEEIIKKCNSYDKQVGCYNTFDGKCKKEKCQIYNLLQENAELKEKNEQLENKLQLRTANDKESDAYWDSIFDEDYPFNKENVYKELCDYYFVLNQLPEIYLYITGGRLSKTTYFASSVKEAFDDAIQYYYDKIDDLEDLVGQYKQALEEIRGIINNHIKCFYGNCKACLYYQECDMQNVECDCSKYHIDKINEVLDGSNTDSSIC